MTAKTIDRLDAAANIVLLIWVGMAICVNIFVIPLIIKYTNSYELAELMIAKLAMRLDTVAWIAFAVSFFLVKSTRLIMGIVEESEAIGPLRLWVAAALLALLTCFVSTFIVAPKLCAVRSHVGIAMDVSNMNINDDSLSHKKAIRISRQLTWLRIIVAIGMAAGIRALPRKL
jgi:hypothetical protein